MALLTFEQWLAQSPYSRKRVGEDNQQWYKSRGEDNPAQKVTFRDVQDAYKQYSQSFKTDLVPEGYSLSGSSPYSGGAVFGEKPSDVSESGADVLGGHNLRGYFDNAPFYIPPDVLKLWKDSVQDTDIGQIQSHDAYNAIQPYLPQGNWLNQAFDNPWVPFGLALGGLAGVTSPATGLFGATGTEGAPVVDLTTPGTTAGTTTFPEGVLTGGGTTSVNLPAGGGTFFPTDLPPGVTNPNALPDTFPPDATDVPPTNTPTTPEGGGGGPSVPTSWPELKQFIKDYGGILGPLISGGLGYLGQTQQTDALTELGNRYLNIGAPYRDTLLQSYGPDFDLMSQPGYGKAFNRMADIATRQWSTRGNPANNPGIQGGIMNDVWNQSYLPALANYRGQLGQFGGLGLNTSVIPATQGAQGQGMEFNPLAGAVGSIFGSQRQSPYDDLAQQMANYYRTKV